MSHVAGLSFPEGAVNTENLLTRHFDVRIFGVLRFVIQPSSLLWKRQSVEMPNHRISNKRISKESLLTFVRADFSRMIQHDWWTQ